MTEAYPLHWPAGKPRTQSPTRASFSTSKQIAQMELMKELRMLGAKNVVLSSNLKLRNDGLPYANQPKTNDEGIAVYFVYKGRQTCFACDRWDLSKDNIQAIRKTIEALRGIARWGTGDMMEAAFRGFEALPAPRKQEWWETLDVPKDADQSTIKDAFKKKYQAAQNDLERMILNAVYQESKK